MTYHSKANVSFLQSRTVVSSVSRHSHHLSHRVDSTVDDAFDERVFVGRRRSGQDAQTRPNLVNLRLLDLKIEHETRETAETTIENGVGSGRKRGDTYISSGIFNPSVKFFSLHNEEVFSGLNDATFCSDRSCRVDIIARYHANRDASTLTLLDGVRHLITHWILNPSEGDTHQISNRISFVLEIRFRLDVQLMHCCVFCSISNLQNITSLPSHSAQMCMCCMYL